MNSKQIKQKILQKVYNHLKKQNKKAQSKGGVCAYRLKKGSITYKCAIGCLIPDKEYNPKFEGMIIDWINDPKWLVLNSEERVLANELKQILKKSCNIKRWSKSMGDFLQTLQDLHDDFEVQEWRSKFIIFAKINKLHLRL